MEFAIGRSDMEPREGLAQSFFISMKGDQIIIQMGIDHLEFDFAAMRLRGGMDTFDKQKMTFTYESKVSLGWPAEDAISGGYHVSA